MLTNKRSRGKHDCFPLLLLLAVRTRFELVTSCVTGRHSNLLN